MAGVTGVACAVTDVTDSGAKLKRFARKKGQPFRVDLCLSEQLTSAANQPKTYEIQSSSVQRIGLQHTKRRTNCLRD